MWRKRVLVEGTFTYLRCPGRDNFSYISVRNSEKRYIRNKKLARLEGWLGYENTVAWQKGRKGGRSHGWEDNRRALFRIYNNMWTVSSDVSIQRRYWQPPRSIYELTVPTQPMMWMMWMMWCVKLDHTTWSTSPTLFKQWCGFFYVP